MKLLNYTDILLSLWLFVSVLGPSYGQSPFSPLTESVFAIWPTH